MPPKSARLQPSRRKEKKLLSPHTVRIVVTRGKAFSFAADPASDAQVARALELAVKRFHANATRQENQSGLDAITNFLSRCAARELALSCRRNAGPTAGLNEWLVSRWTEFLNRAAKSLKFLRGVHKDELGGMEIIVELSGARDSRGAKLALASQTREDESSDVGSKRRRNLKQQDVAKALKTNDVFPGKEFDRLSVPKGAADIVSIKLQRGEAEIAELRDRIDAAVEQTIRQLGQVSVASAAEGRKIATAVTNFARNHGLWFKNADGFVGNITFASGAASAEKPGEFFLRTASGMKSISNGFGDLSVSRRPERKPRSSRQS